jgi:hypothetical protein
MDTTKFINNRMRLYQLFEASNPPAHGRTVVIFPGRFQPFHKGHYETYRALEARFPGADVWIATSGVVGPDSPFSFEERRALAALMGIPATRIAQVKSPYNPQEILQNYDPARDTAIFALSKKDEERIGYKPKKDGSPAYMQPYSPNQAMEPLGKHGYVMLAPIVNFKVNGASITGATQIRELLQQGDAKTTAQVLKDMYGADKFKVAAKIILPHFPVNNTQTA